MLRVVRTQLQAGRQRPASLVGSSSSSLGSRRHYQAPPSIPVLPPNGGAKEDKLSRDAVPPVMPPMPPSIPAGSTTTAGAGAGAGAGDKIVPPLTPTEKAIPKTVPFGTEPVKVVDTPTVLPRRTHRLRNLLLVVVFGGAAVFAGGVYGSLKNDTVYELFTESVPYGEEAVLYLQEREFRNRFPEAHTHIAKGSKRSYATNVYIPSSGVEARVRETQPEILAKGPQNSAKADDHKASAASPMNATGTNRNAPKQAAPEAKSAALDSKSGAAERKAAPPAAATAEAAPAVPGPRGPIPEAPARAPAASTAAKAAATAPATIVDAGRGSGVEVMTPVQTAKIAQFDLADTKDRSIDRLVFAINGIVQTANEYGSSPHFRACLEDAKDEVRAMNAAIGKVQGEAEQRERVRFDGEARTLRAKLDDELSAVSRRAKEREASMATELERERARLDHVYHDRLSAEVRRVESIGEQRLANELTEQAIQLQRIMRRDVRTQVEQERGGRLGRLEQLQKSVQELKQLELDSTDYVRGRARVQDLEVALSALKAVLDEPVARPVADELAAIRELAGPDDDLVRAAVSAIGGRDTADVKRGVPTLAQLADRFRSVRDKVHSASLAPEDAGAGGHFLSTLLSAVMFQKRGMVAGDDVAARLARAEAYLEANDLDSALRECNALKGWPKVLIADWLTLARKHLEVKQAVDVLQTSAVLEALRLRQAEQRAA